MGGYLLEATTSSILNLCETELSAPMRNAQPCSEMVSEGGYSSCTSALDS
jgi:hypothetical protein